MAALATGVLLAVLVQSRIPRGSINYLLATVHYLSTPYVRGQGVGDHHRPMGKYAGVVQISGINTGPLEKEPSCGI